MKKSVFLLLLAPLTLAACVGSTTEPGDEGAAADELVERTIVTIAADGTPTSRVVTVTRAEVLREVAERAHLVEAAPGDEPAGDEAVGTAQQAATVYDGSCAGCQPLGVRRDRGPELPRWQPFGVGLPWKKYNYHEICFMTDNTAAWGVYLQDYTRALRLYPQPPLTWQSATRSYWPGSNAGYFMAGEFGLENFSAGGPLANAGANAQSSWYLELDQ